MFFQSIHYLQNDQEAKADNNDDEKGTCFRRYFCSNTCRESILESKTHEACKVGCHDCNLLASLPCVLVTCKKKNCFAEQKKKKKKKDKDSKVFSQPC